MVEQFKENLKKSGNPAYALLAWRIGIAQRLDKLPEQEVKKLAGIWKEGALRVFGGRDFLTEAKQRIWNIKFTISISNPAICANLLGEIAQLNIKQFSKNPIESITGYDTSLGLIAIASAVTLALEEIRGTTDQLSLDAKKELANLKIDNLIDKEDTDLIIIESKQRLEKFKKFLIEDPTGFSLVDEESRDFLNPFEFCISELTRAGAEVGVILYKKFYNLCPPVKNN